MPADLYICAGSRVSIVTGNDYTRGLSSQTLDQRGFCRPFYLFGVDVRGGGQVCFFGFFQPEHIQDYFVQYGGRFLQGHIDHGLYPNFDRSCFKPDMTENKNISFADFDGEVAVEIGLGTPVCSFNDDIRPWNGHSI